MASRNNNNNNNGGDGGQKEASGAWEVGERNMYSIANAKHEMLQGGNGNSSATQGQFTSSTATSTGAAPQPTTTTTTISAGVLFGATIGLLFGGAGAAAGVFVSMRPAVLAMEDAARAAEKASLEMEELAATTSRELPSALRSMTASAQEVTKLTTDIQTITETVTNRFLGVSSVKPRTNRQSRDDDDDDDDAAKQKGLQKQTAGKGNGRKDGDQNADRVPADTALLRAAMQTTTTLDHPGFSLSRVGLTAEKVEHGMSSTHTQRERSLRNTTHSFICISESYACFRHVRMYHWHHVLLVRWSDSICFSMSLYPYTCM